MADVKICDRCGKKLDIEMATFSLKPIKPSRYTLTMTLFGKKDYWGEQKKVTANHDLCMDCACELAKWMDLIDKEE